MKNSCFANCLLNKNFVCDLEPIVYQLCKRKIKEPKCPNCGGLMYVTHNKIVCVLCAREYQEEVGND